MDLGSTVAVSLYLRVELIPEGIKKHAELAKVSACFL